MSRGLGKLQRSILENLGEGPVQANALRWRLWTAGNDGKDMAKPFYASFNRALDLLDEKVIRDRRKLQTLGELTTYYPFKTPLLQIKRLREELLPLVEEFVSEGAERYSVAENEEFLFKQVSKAERQSCQAAWQKLEPKVFTIMATVPFERKAPIVEVMARAWQLFGLKRGVSHRRSFCSLIDQAFPASDDPLEDAVGQELDALCRRCFPGVSLPLAHLKSQLYSAFVFGQRSRPYAKEGFKDFLKQQHFSFVESLPGCKHSPRRPLESKARLYVTPPTRVPEIIDKIISRDALGSFDFLRLA
ncbi:MAG: hypothetical protein LAP85_14880 [Acidobacteriia bacterium]|nr:hypothetical protein [Terriglobia bacterium]